MRMGRPKLLLPWGSTSVLGHHLATWRALGAAQIGLVCRADDAPMTAELDRLHVSPRDRILNHAPEEGMFSSVCAAARGEHWRPELSHWAVILGDQPQVSAETLQQLLVFAAARPECICQPAHKGRPRHPVILPRSYFRQLTSSGARDLKAFLEERVAARAFREIDDYALEVDLDTPEDYDKAVKCYQR
jgi:molybdenum cofactor cytidylyltransferase